MPKIYKNRITRNEPIRLRRQAEPILYPQVIGQQAGASFVDYSNPRQREIAIYPGTPVLEYQKALDALNTIGGGTLIFKTGTHILNNITLESYSNVNLIGEGVGSTILDFGLTSGGINFKGIVGSIKRRARISNFKLINSNNAAGLDIDYVVFFTIDNVEVETCNFIGIRIQHSQDFLIDNVTSDSNGTVGFQVLGDATNSFPTRRFSFRNCLSTGNDGGAGGFEFNNSVGSGLSSFTLIGCRSDFNVGDGFDFTNSAANYLFEGTIIGCLAVSNTVNGFDVNSSASGLRLIGNYATSNNGDGFEVDSLDSTLIGNYSTSAVTGAVSYDINVTTTNVRNTLIGNTADSGATLDPSTEFSLDQGIATAFLNVGQGTRNIRDIVRMKNTSGGQLVLGDVVTRKAVATGDEVTTTTTGGDDLVFGVALATIENNEWGSFQVLGLNTSVKVNGTTDIAIGDFLSTFTTAKIAKKASAGDAVFAIALEAYATDDSLGVIDAMLIPIRLI